MTIVFDDSDPAAILFIFALSLPSINTLIALASTQFWEPFLTPTLDQQSHIVSLSLQPPVCNVNPIKSPA
jgi:hypothetical protein